MTSLGYIDNLKKKMNLNVFGVQKNTGQDLGPT